MTKKTRNLETAAEIINKQEREITEEEENLTQDPKTINLEKEEEDKIHQAIIDMTTNQIKVETEEVPEATPETVEEVLEVKAGTEEAPEVEVEIGVDLTEVKVETGIASAEAEATLLIEEVLHQTEEEDNMKGAREKVEVMKKEIILE